MGDKKYLGAGGAALMSVIVLALVMAPAAEAASKYNVLHAFYGSDGYQPYAGLIFDAAGNLYGTTLEGGTGCQIGCGTVFKLSPNADGRWTESVLHRFNGNDGSIPVAGLIFDATGNLYGTTYAGGAISQGTVFKLTANADGSWTESVLHSFNGSDGAYPYAGLIFDAAGSLYGTAYEGGSGTGCSTNGCGTIFKLTPNADGRWTESVLHSFNNTDGATPEAGLIFDAAGNLYGTTIYGGFITCGGGNGCGVVFKLTRGADGSWTESVLHSFGRGSDGADPVAGLIFDTAGNLYGTTEGAGAHGYGAVFKLTPSANGSWTESVLHSFEGNGGEQPWAGLIFDAAGNLYGTTYGGGASFAGTVFKLTPNADGRWTESVLHSFEGKPATTPGLGSLVFGSAGALYGTTEECSSGCEGVVYQITP
jgi:uncharacterized repeat protein (TIGR03803 family)